MLLDRFRSERGWVTNYPTSSQRPCSRFSVHRLRAGLHLSLLASLIFVTSISQAQQSPIAGRWQASLETPGGPLEFQLKIPEWKSEGGPTTAEIVNGPERIAVNLSRESSSRFSLSFEHYDSQLEFEKVDEALVGVWAKTRGPDKVAELAFRARRLQPRPLADPSAFLGRWQVNFAESDDPAIGVFGHFGPRGDVVGTFLTTTGDYRYLYGYVRAGALQLSCFDGAHAFLFRARPNDDGSLSGDFWSGNWHHEKWTAQLSSDAKLPDGFMQTSTTERTNLAGLSFPDVDGQLRSLRDPELCGKVTLIEIFGSWCPNCHDEAAYLSELRAKYARDNVQVVGLAFELTGDSERDALQVKRYCARFEIDYPVLIAGTADKAAASKLLPMIDRVRSFPTTLFVDAAGSIRAVYTGFSGPATGAEHRQLRRRFEALIEQLLAE